MGCERAHGRLLDLTWRDFRGLGGLGNERERRKLVTILGAIWIWFMFCL